VSARVLFGTTLKRESARETIVLIRQGEKPKRGLGQITCQGLNRALALPAVIAKKFGKPEAIFAPDPSQPIEEAGELYDYVRPLATIEPTAITFGLPVRTGIGLWDKNGLQAALEEPRYENAFVLIAWEHATIEAVARALLAAHGGDPSVVPKWRGDDFDSIYVVTIAATAEGKKASFALEHQGLDGQPEACPGPAKT